MTSFVRRLVVTVATLLIVSLLVFLIPYLTPGDPARKIIRARVNDPNLDAAAVEQLRVLHGFDQPIMKQYGE